MPNDMERRNWYNHPYEPYEIQLDLMDVIYETIDKDFKVGIFESPTGTGKTLSIICSTMTWLRNYKRNTATFKKNDSGDESSDDEPEWVKKAYQDTIASRTKSKIQDYERHLDNVSKEYQSQKVEVSEVNSRVKRIRSKEDTIEEAEFLPDDYYSDSEYNKLDENALLSKEIHQLLQKAKDRDSEVEVVNECPTSILYSSRTHSQLHQLADQLNLTKFDSSFDNIEERIKYLPLGSRKQLCINKKVRNISNSDSNVNDACIDLQKSKAGCDFLPSDKESLFKKFTDFSFTRIHDIEDLGRLGKLIKVCPYYSVRRGTELSELISLPYQMLLHEGTRDVLNIDISDSIVVIDEAHNLLDVINAMNSVGISSIELNAIIKSLKFYMGKFMKRLNSGNRINLLKLIKLCSTLIRFIEKSGAGVTSGSEIKVEDIFQDSNADMVNASKIEAFLSKSKIAYKIETYMENMGDHKASNSNPLLFKLAKFLKSLNNPSKEGRFYWDKVDNNTTINYMLLDPSEIFREIIEKAKCVLLCGGTMEPMDDYKKYLFPYLKQSKINTFSCNHIIPDDNLKVFPIHEYYDSPFEFSFGKRNDISMIKSLGRSIIDICNNTPDGVVAFFPSYKYLAQVMNIWKQDGILTELDKTKKVFQESNVAGHVDTTLTDYSRCIKSEKRSAIIFSVVGGRLSEGINFSDELARGVIMVGLPFPNAFSGEIVARREFIEARALQSGGTLHDAKELSRNFYENICMRAVNQSIGRSIRHSKDYSVIFLIDSRYSKKNIQAKLSNWVRRRVFNDIPYQGVLRQTEEFFHNKISV